MNIQELKRAVEALGFGPIGDDRVFLMAANCALHQIFSDRPITGRVRLPMTAAEAGDAMTENGFICLPLLIPDFLAPWRGVTDYAGRDCTGSYIEGDLLMPIDLWGKETYLTYIRTPIPITPEPGETIDVPAECAPLLPLLTASMIWLDDEPEKAQYYMNLYRERMERVRRFHNRAANANYTVIAGWGG